MNAKDDIPTIEGVPLHTAASQIMANPAAAAGASATPVEYYRPTTILELISGIPARCSNPQLAQMFMLDALEKFSETASQLDVAAFDESEMGGVISGAAWKQAGFEINSIIRDHIDWVNAQASTPDLPTTNNQEAGMSDQQPVQEYIEKLKARPDWSAPLSAELLEMKERLDPTGEIAAQFTREQLC